MLIDLGNDSGLMYNVRTKDKAIFDAHIHEKIPTFLSRFGDIVI
jgi:hypothetical protein